MPDARPASLLIAVAVALLALARGLPARTFFTGDSGVKLIVARNAIAHPLHPLDVDLPRVAGQPVGFADPFFHVHGEYAHAATPDLFPLLSAPLIALFGIRGAYILPAVGFLVAVWAIPAIGIALDERRSRWMLLVVALACTPLLFYALEFWEHTLAVGAAAAATACFVTRRSRLGLFITGALLGVAVLLRPEGIWFAVGLLIAARWLPNRPGIGQLAAAAISAAIVIASFAAVSAMSSGQLFGAHVTRNMSHIATGWATARIEYLRLWLVPPTIVWVAVTILFVAGIAAGSRRSLVKPVHVAGALFAAVLAFGAANEVFDRASIWNAAPVAIGILVVPLVRIQRGEGFLLVLAAISSALVVLTIPSDGGAQWGPRYLCFAFIPLAILAADRLTATMRTSRVGGAMIVTALLLPSVVVQRNAYKELQGTKRIYERIVEFVERETAPGSYIVTDLWWFDQVTAALYPTRVVLFVDDAASAAEALRLMKSAPEFFVLRSEGEPRIEPGTWPDAEPFTLERQAGIPERTLRLAHFVHR